MKMREPAIAIAMSMLSCIAYAQSNVTLYGVLDEGISYNSNSGGHPLVSMQSGVLLGNRLGLGGTEVLGGRGQALFVLESGFDVDNGKSGQGGLLFGRQAYVGVANRYATVTLGRQYDVASDFVGPFAASRQWAGNIGAHPGDMDNLVNTVRTNNAIKVTSASFGGFSAGAMYSFGEVPGDASRKQAWSVGAGYANGPFAAGLGYMNVRDANLSFFGNATTGTPSADVANSAYPVYSGFLSARTFQVVGAGFSYKFSRATLGATYTNVAFKGLGDKTVGPNPNGYMGDTHFDNAELNVSYQLAPQILLGAAYEYTQGSGVSGAKGRNDGAKYQAGVLSAQYLLSKRSTLYLLGVYQAASGTDSLNKAATASINNQAVSASNRQAAVRVGILHKF